MPHYRLCYPCQAHYYFIRKYETLDTQTGLSREKYLVSGSDQQRKTGVDGYITAAYFNNVSPDDEKT